MPAADPLDQQAARAIESSLREAVARRERPRVELDWLLALPKRIRRSGKLLETAQAEAKVLLEHVRSAWAKAVNAEQEREERLVRARARPRDLDCLHAPDAHAWNGLGRRKKRCRTFEAVGRAFNARQKPPIPSAATPAPVSDILAVHEAPPRALSRPPSRAPSGARSRAPTRPPTPPGIREALYNTPGLLALAHSRADPARHGLPTPCEPSPPPAPRVVRRPPSPCPRPEPCLAYEGETVIGEQVVDCRLAYLVSLGRWEACRWAKPPTLREAAEQIVGTEQMQPGALLFLMELFFPHGLDDWSTARPKLLVLRDVVNGWYAVALWAS